MRQLGGGAGEVICPPKTEPPLGDLKILVLRDIILRAIQSHPLNFLGSRVLPLVKIS